MEPTALRDSLTALVANDRLEDAIKQLSAYWQGRHVGLHQLLPALQRRLSLLRTQQIKGVITAEDAAVERARVADDLLAIISQVGAERPRVPGTLDRQPAGGRPTPWWAFAALLAVLAVASLYLLTNRAAGPNLPPPAAFDLFLYLHEAGDTGRAVTQGQVRLLIGPNLLSAQPINANGQVTFTNIPGTYLNDPIQIIPVEMRYKVEGQSVQRAEEGRHISVALTPLPDTTFWRGVVVDQGRRPVAEAQLNVESGLATTQTDEQGNFRVAVPRAVGESVQVSVTVDGQVRRRASYALSNTVPVTIMLNER